MLLLIIGFLPDEELGGLDPIVVVDIGETEPSVRASVPLIHDEVLRGAVGEGLGVEGYDLEGHAVDVLAIVLAGGKVLNLIRG